MKSSSCVVNGGCTLKGGVSCEVDKVTNRLSIPEPVKVEARRTCSNVVSNKVGKRQPLPLVAVSSVYAACRENRLPITIKELAEEGRLSDESVGRLYRRIADRLGITPPVPNGTKYVDRVAAEVGASDEARRISQVIERKAVEAGLGARSPMVLAAASVYTACLMCGENRTQSEVAEVAGVDVISLRECAKLIRALPDLGGTPTETTSPVESNTALGHTPEGQTSSD